MSGLGPQQLVAAVVAVGCAVAAVWIVVLLVRDRTPARWLLNLLAALEVLLVVHLVIGVVRALGPGAPDALPVWEYVGYLVGAVLLLPAGVIWSSGERTRGGTAVLLVAVLVVPFMFVRLSDIWTSATFAGPPGG